MVGLLRDQSLEQRTRFGQAVVAEMAIRPLASLAPPTLISRPDVHVPFNAALETSIPRRSRGF